MSGILIDTVYSLVIIGSVDFYGLMMHLRMRSAVYHHPRGVLNVQKLGV